MLLNAYYNLEEILVISEIIVCGLDRTMLNGLEQAFDCVSDKFTPPFNDFNSMFL